MCIRDRYCPSHSPHQAIVHCTFGSRDCLPETRSSHDPVAQWLSLPVISCQSKLFVAPCVHSASGPCLPPYVLHILRRHQQVHSAEHSPSCSGVAGSSAFSRTLACLCAHVTHTQRPTSLMHLVWGTIRITQVTSQTNRVWATKAGRHLRYVLVCG